LHIGMSAISCVHSGYVDRGMSVQQKAYRLVKAGAWID
jgi:hypothetical protein